MESRRRNARSYIRQLRDIPCLTLPVQLTGFKNVYWMFAVLISGTRRAQVQKRLQQQGIDTRVFFKPLHRQKVLKAFGFRSQGKFPVSDRLHAQGLYLPSSSGLKQRDIVRVCKALRGALDR